MIVKQNIGIGILAPKGGKEEVSIEDISNFAKASEAGIRDLIVIAIPRLSVEAQRFAETRNIKAFTPTDLDTLFKRQRLWVN